MPIGTIIGFLIGTLIIGGCLTLANNDFQKTFDPTLQSYQQRHWMLGCGTMIISCCALAGTFIEILLT